MKKILSTEGNRRPSGWHTGKAIYSYKGKYYVSQESGTRPATKAEIRKIKREDAEWQKKSLKQNLLIL